MQTLKIGDSTFKAEWICVTEVRHEGIEGGYMFFATVQTYASVIKDGMIKAITKDEEVEISQDEYEQLRYKLIKGE